MFELPFDSRIKWSDKRKKKIYLDTLLPIHNMKRGEGRDNLLYLFHQSRYSFFLSPDATGRITLRNRTVPFNSLFLLLPPHPTEKCWDLSSIFSLLSPSPPLPLSFFSFLFILFIEPSQRLISRIPSVDVVQRIGCARGYSSLYLLEWLYIYYSPINLINIGCSLITASLYYRPT